MIRVRVPASTSNLGAGFDCLGLALDLWLEVAVEDGEGRAQYGGTLEGLDPAADLIAAIVGPLARGRRLAATSSIPVGRGLGSSAAAIVAALAVRRLLDGAPLAHEAIFRDAVQREGHPDNAGPAVYGGLVLSAHRPEPLGISDTLGIALAIPEATVDTKAARAMLPADFPREIATLQAASAAALVIGLTTGDGSLIGFGMDDHVAAPYRKQLIPGFDAAVAAGRDHGAFGVTISGSGSTLVAVTPRERAGAVAEAMATALTAAGNPATAATPSVSLRGLTVNG